MGKSSTSMVHAVSRVRSLVTLTLSCVGVLICGSARGATYTSLKDSVTDIALPASWNGNQMPGTTSSDVALFQNLEKTLTASSDTTFGLMQYNRVGSMQSMNLVFDMTDATAGVASGAGPRKINVLGMRLEMGNTSVELKGGLWNFNTPTQYPSWNVIFSAASNAVLTLSSGAVVTNIAAAGYNHFSGAKNSSIRLVGASKWYGKSALWPFKGGSGNEFQVRDGSSVSATVLDLGRLDTTSTTLCRNRVEVSGAGSSMKFSSTAYVGGSSAAQGASNGNELHVTNQAVMTVGASTLVGAGTFGNLLRIADKATYNAVKFIVGGQSGSTGNVARVENEATLKMTGTLTVGRGTKGNSLLVDNATVQGTGLELGTTYNNVRGCSNLVRVTGTKSSFKMTGGSTAFFGAGDYNTFEVDGATLDLGCSVEFSSSDLSYTNRGNTVRLKNGAQLKVNNFRLGSSKDRGAHTLDISDGSTLSANWLMAYSNDVVRIKIPANGLSAPAISVGSYLTFKGTSVLDIDAFGWSNGPRTCELMRSNYGTAAQIAFNQEMLDATNARLAGQFLVSVTADGKALQIRRLMGFGIVVR